MNINRHGGRGGGGELTAFVSPVLKRTQNTSHSFRRLRVAERHRKFRRAAFDEVKRPYSARARARRGHRHVPDHRHRPCALVSVPLGLFIRAEERRFRVTGSLACGRAAACRVARVDDSITPAEPRVSYRDNPPEVGGAIRSWRPETHADIYARARARLRLRLSLSLLPICRRETRMERATLGAVTREQPNKESPTARSDREKARRRSCLLNGRTFTWPGSGLGFLGGSTRPSG